jgi:hypothetical protein
MYVSPNFKSKKALRDAIALGQEITVFAPGLGTPKTDGIETVEGPHYPAPHSWYAQVEMREGKVVRLVK